MADQQRWFKLWCTAPGDDAIQALPVADRWAWAAFGCYTKAHGTRGRIVVSRTNTVLAAEIGIVVEDLFATIKRLPHVCVNEENTANGTLTVTWQNWQKYQEDSTVSQRVARLRSKKRRDEKRREVDSKAVDSSTKSKSQANQEFASAIEQPLEDILERINRKFADPSGEGPADP